MRFEPMKAVLTDEPFSDPSWIYERKLDGIRILAYRENGEVRLESRIGHSRNASFPDLVKELQKEPFDDFVIDGEVVAFEGSRTSFQKLQRGRGPVYYYVFDILQARGEDVTGRPLRERKRILRDALEFHDHVRFTTHRNGDGEDYFRYACRHGWEGLIAKRADGPYVQKRSRDWLKFKCSAEQELVIGGFTAPQGSRTDFGALLVGYYEDGKLKYAGKVGTGFSQETLRSLGKRMRDLERDSSAFDQRVHPVPRGTRWIEPELVGQFGFSEWTRDGRLRHPRFLGLRDDKPAREVVRERP
ncbi:MAG: non-homologous end-joining DNA ligase [Thermoleophilaceae bacterium]